MLLSIKTLEKKIILRASDKCEAKKKHSYDKTKHFRRDKHCSQNFNVLSFASHNPRVEMFLLLS